MCDEWRSQFDQQRKLAGKKATKLASKMAGKAAGKAAAKLGAGLAKSLMKATAAPLLIFEVVSMALDMADVEGYNSAWHEVQ